MLTNFVGATIDGSTMTRYLPGDVLSRRKGLVMHRGIALGDGRVLHNTPFRGEHIATVAEFAAGRRVYVERAARDRRARALAHAEYGTRAGYNLLTNNCEHTVSRASTGAATSPQLRGLLAGAVAGAVVFGVTRHPAATAVAFAAVRRWASRLT